MKSQCFLLNMLDQVSIVILRISHRKLLYYFISGRRNIVVLLQISVSLFLGPKKTVIFFICSLKPQKIEILLPVSVLLSGINVKKFHSFVSLSVPRGIARFDLVTSSDNCSVYMAIFDDTISGSTSNV